MPEGLLIVLWWMSACIIPSTVIGGMYGQPLIGMAVGIAVFGVTVTVAVLLEWRKERCDEPA